MCVSSCYAVLLRSKPARPLQIEVEVDGRPSLGITNTYAGKTKIARYAIGSGQIFPNSHNINFQSMDTESFRNSICAVYLLKFLIFFLSSVLAQNCCIIPFVRWGVASSHCYCIYFHINLFYIFHLSSGMYD